MAEFKDFDIRQSSRIRINVRGNAEGEMLMQDEKDGEIRAVISGTPIGGLAGGICGVPYRAGRTCFIFYI